MSDRLEAEYDPNILFCIENVCLWINQAYTNEPLLVEAQDFIILRRIVQVPLGFVFDVEHFYVSTVMKFFYAELKEDFVRLQNGDVTYDEIRCKFERVLREYVSLGNTKLIGDECSKVIKEAFVLLDPYIEYVHVCGSDYTCYFYNSKGGFPVVGEHLPLGYKGFVEHNAVEDQVEHREWISVLKHKEMDVVLEISAKEGYNFFEQVKKSAEFIESLLDN